MADRSIKVRLEAEVGGYTRGMGQAAKATDAVGKAVDSQKKSLKQMGAFWQANRADIDQVANSMVLMGAAGVAALAGVTKVAMDWESAWAGVTKTVNGTAEEMAALEKGLRSMSKEVSASHGEIAAVAAAAGQLGIQTSSIESFTRTMIDMGETTNLSADEAATSLARFMNVMGTSQADVDRLGSTIVGLGNNFATTEQEIMEMAMRLSGAGQQIGLAESDVLAMATAMSSVGIEAEAGGTAMSMTMKRIGREVEMNGDKLGLFAQVAGMSADQFKVAWGENAAGALNDFVGGLANTEKLGMSTTAVLDQLGIAGIRESDALLRLSGAQGLVNEALALGSDAYAENTALADEAAQRYETTAAQAQMAWNAMKDAAIDFGSVMLPIVADASQGIADLAGWFANLPAPVKQSVVALGGVASVTALVAGGALKLVGSVSDSVLAFQRLTVASPRLAGNLKKVGAAAGVAGAALTAAALAATWDGGEATQGVKEIEAGLKAITEGANATEKVFTGIGKSDWWEASANGAQDLAELLEKISNENFIEKAQGQGVSVLRGATDLVGWDTRTDYERQTKNLQEYLNAIAGAASSDLPAAAAAFKELNDQAGGTTESAQRLLDQSPALRDELIGIASDAGFATDDATLLRVALGELGTSTYDVADLTRGANDALRESVDSLQAEADAANQAAQAKLDLVSANSSLIKSEVAYEESVDRARKTIEENGATLDLSTEKGRENMSVLVDQADRTVQWAEGLKGLGATQEQIDGVLQRGRDTFLGLGKAAGASKGEVKALADQLGLQPGVVRTEVKVNTSEALSAAQRVQNVLYSINGKVFRATVSVGVNGAKELRSVGSGMATAKADGGITYFANGKLPDEAIIQAPQSNLVQWAEPETGGEAFIPLAQSKRARSLEIWKETGRRLGAFESLGLESFAAGGMRSSVSLKDAAKDYRQEARGVSRLVRSVKSARDAVKSAERGVNAASKTDDKGDDKAAKKRLEQAKRQLSRLEDRLKDARDSREDAKRRLADLRAERKDLAVDVRRGNIQDQVGSGLSGALSAVDRIRAGASDTNLTRKQRQSLGKSARQAEKELTRLYAAAEKAEAALDRSRGHLEEMRQVSAGIKSNLSGGFKLTDAFESSQWTDMRGNIAAGEKKISAKGMLSGGKSYAAKLKKFGASIKKLADYGLSSTILQEIALLGPDEGQEVADQLLAGGKKSVQELNGVYKQIESLAGYIGNQSTRNFTTDDGKFYANGVYQAQADVKAQQKRLDSINGSIEKWGDKIAKILGKAYGVKMASGGWVTGGIKGVDSVPITGMPGEYMVNARAASQYGPLLESINTGRGLPVMATAIPTQTNVNVALDKASVAAAWDGMKVVLEVDGKPMKAVMRTEMNAAFSAAGRGY